MWEPVYGINPWVTLGAIAAQTARIKIGTLLTPPSRRRPWKLASETLTVYLVSGGRMILSVGMGAWGWPKSMQRLLKCDGILPTIIDKDKKFSDLTPDHVRQIKDFVDQNRVLKSNFDIIVENTSPGDNHSAAVTRYNPGLTLALPGGLSPCGPKKILKNGENASSRDRLIKVKDFVHPIRMNAEYSVVKFALEGGREF